MNKLPNSMKNVVEKIKNIHIPNVSPKLSVAGFGNVGERKILGELVSAVKSETKGTGEGSNIPPAFKQEEFSSTYDQDLSKHPQKQIQRFFFEGARDESLCILKPPPDPT